MKSNVLNYFEDELVDEINSIGIKKTFETGDIIIDLGEKIKYIPIVFRGTIKIMKEDNNGSDLLLYYLQPGDSCSVSMNCCLTSKRSEIRAIAESDTELILFPNIKMEEWLVKYPSWRSFVLNSYNNRIDELFKTINLIAFENLDERLTSYLEKKSIINKSNILNLKHQEIADDLNTSRVVISRLLKKLENKNYLKINRKSVELIK
jgi:CRP/FNR family transcriptional regulator